MKNQIEKAIIETLVIDNKQSVHIAVDKIMSIVNDRWISVDERLPEHNDAVLVCNANFKGDDGKADPLVTIAFQADENGFQLIEVDEYTDEVTHWQPLPTAPKQTTQTT